MFTNKYHYDHQKQRKQRSFTFFFLLDIYLALVRLRYFKIFKEKALEIIGKASNFNEMRNAFISVKNDFFALKQKISDIQVPELEIRSLIDLYRWSYQNHLNKAIFLLSVISEKFEIVTQRRIPRPNRSCCKKEIKNCYFCFWDLYLYIS